jgi:hypothetical protein
VPEPNEPQSLNRLSWVRGNPLKYRDPSGHGCTVVNDDEVCGDDIPDELPPELLDLLLVFLSDPEFLGSIAWLLPSGIGVYQDVGGALGCGAEFEGYPFHAYVFNWRSGQLSHITGVELGAYGGTPRVVTASTGGGAMFVWGASDNDALGGVDVYSGAIGGIDVIGYLGLGVTESKALYLADTNGNGLPEFQDANGNGWPDLYIDPHSRMQISTLQVGLDVGANGFPNAVDIGGVAGVSVTTVHHLVPGWSWKWYPWNW